MHSMHIFFLNLKSSSKKSLCLRYSVEIYSYYVEQVITDMRCKIAGFSITFLGLVSISHLVGVAIERYSSSFFLILIRAPFSLQYYQKIYRFTNLQSINTRRKEFTEEKTGLQHKISTTNWMGRDDQSSFLISFWFWYILFLWYRK